MALKFLNDGYFAGKVGIGTDSPSYKLDVNGNVQLQASLYVRTRIQGLNSGGSYSDLILNDLGANVGVGTASPNAKLEVNSAITFSTIDTFGQLVVKAASGSTGDMLNIGVDTANSVAFIQANDRGVGTIPLSLQRYGGNVGIGATNPSEKLEVAGNARITGDVTLSNGNALRWTSDDVRIEGTTAGDNIKFYVANTEILQLAQSGTLATVTGNLRVTGAYYDSNNSPGTANQVLVSTVTGTDWVDGSGSSIIGGPYLPLTAGSSYPLTGRLDLTSAGGTGIRIVTGDTSEGYLIFGDAADNSMGGIAYNNNTNTLSIDCNNSERITILSTGNVGIGTTNPAYKLDVNSSAFVGARVESTASGYAPASILLESGNSDSRGQGIYQYNSVSKNSWFSGVPYSTTSDDWVIAHKLETTAFNSDVAQMSNALFCVNDNGNVGIGTTSPSQKLTVEGNIELGTGGYIYGDTTTSYLRLNNAAGSLLGYSNAYIGLGPSFVYNVGGSEKFRIASSTGNVGIGTTNPGTKLDIAVTPSAAWMKLINADETAFNLTTYNNGTNNGNTAYAFKHGLYYNSTENATVTFYRGGSSVGGFLTFTTNNGSERMRIDSAGNVGIQNTNPSGNAIGDGGKNLVVGNNANANHSSAISIISGATAGFSYLLFGDGDGTAGYQGQVRYSNADNSLEFVTSQSEKMSISSTGALKLNTYGAGTLVSDGSGNITSVPAGPGNVGYLPLSAGSSYPLTGTLLGTSTNFSGSGDYAGNMTLGTGASTAEAHLQIGQGRTGNGYSYIDLIGDATYSDYGFRIIRNNSGPNTSSAILHRGTGNLEISANDSASILLKTNGATALTLDNSQNATFAGNVTATNILTVAGAATGNPYLQFTQGGSQKAYIQYVDTGNDFVLQSDGSFRIYTGGTSTAFTINTSQNATFAGNVNLPDNNKLLLGTGNDLEIYHNGSDSYIKDAGAGDLRIVASATKIYDADLSHLQASFTDGGSVDLYYSGNKKFETTSTGVTVTGKATITNDIILSQVGPRIDFDNGSAGSLRLFSVSENAAAITITSAGNLTAAGQGFSAATSSGDASSTLTTKGYVDGLITGATIYRGTWDPDVSLNSGYGNPNLNTVTQTSGYYYICSADGTATPNGPGTGPNTWSVGDWVIWNDDLGTSGEWQKIDNSSVLSGVGTGQTVALWEGPNTVTDSETLGNAPITVSGNNTTFAGNVALTGDLRVTADASTADIVAQWADSNGNNTATFRTTTPGQIFEIRSQNNGTLKFDSSSATFTGQVNINSGNDLRLYRSDNATYARFNYAGGSVGLDIDDLNGDGINLQQAGVNKLRIETSGNATFAGTVDVDGGTLNVGSSNQVNIVASGASTFPSLKVNNSGYLGSASVPTQMQLLSSGSTIFSGLVSGITPVNAANFVTKAYVDGSGGGTGPFLPLAGGTITGNLTVNGTTTLGNQLTFPYGYLSDYIYHTGDSNTYFGFVSNDNFIVATSGAERMRINGSGNVGIGTTGPLEKLHVIGNVFLNANSAYKASYNNTDSYHGSMRWAGLQLGNNGVNKIAAGRTSAGGSFQFWTNNTNDVADYTVTPDGIMTMSMTNAGNVGIGTTSPDAILETSKEVAGNQVGALLTNTRQAGTADSVSLNFGLGRTADGFIFNTPAIKFLKEQQWTGTGSTVDGSLVFSTIQNETVAERMRIFSNGNVNIGVAETGSSAVTGPFVVTHSSSRFLTSSFEEGTVSLSAKNNNNNLESLRLAGDSIKFFNGTNTVGSQKMVILSNGNVGIGATGPSSKLQVEAAAGQATTLNNSVANSALRINADTVNGSNNIRIGESGSGSYFLQVSNSAGTTPYAINLNPFGGNVGIGTTSPAQNFVVANATNGQGVEIIPGTTGTIQAYNRATSVYVPLNIDTLEARVRSIGATIFNNGSGFSESMRIYSTGLGVKTTSVTAALNVLDSTSTAVKATRIGNDTTSIYRYTTQADAVLAWTCGSYHNAEVVITASQTNGGDYNNLYIRGIWSNNHTSHHWDELEHVGGLTGSTITMSVGQNGSTTNSGRLELDFNYISGSFSTLNIRVTDFYGSHSYTIT